MAWLSRSHVLGAATNPRNSGHLYLCVWWRSFIQGARHELSGHKPGMMTQISLGIVVAFAASLTSSLGFSKLTSGAVNAQFLRHFRLNVIDNGTVTQLGAPYLG
jgi:hypothetical protein